MINVWQRSQLSCEVATFFFDFNQEEEEEEWWSEKDRRAVKDEDVISGHVKHQGREQIGRPSGLMHQTQLSIICGFHYHGNTSMKGHLGASRFPTAFLQKPHPQRGMIFHVNVGNALPISELITAKVLTFGKFYFPAWVHEGEEIPAQFFQTSWWQSRVKVSTNNTRTTEQRPNVSSPDKRIH